jgi:hypothetical protein
MKQVVKYTGFLICFCLNFACQQKSRAPQLPVSVTVKAPKKTREYDLTNAKSILHNGDIVLRTGRDVISGMFAQLNKSDRTFSHCGLAFQENGEWVVYHAIGGEDNPDQKVKRDKLETFTSSKNNLGFGICRYTLDNAQLLALKQTTDSIYKAGTPFDMQFSLQSDDRLYCAELIYKTFHKALKTTNFFETTQHRGFEYVSTDNLFVNNNARILCHIVY